jgi:alpha-ketoglutarate-dependent taurine dioxygenase
MHEVAVISTVLEVAKSNTGGFDHRCGTPILCSRHEEHREEAARSIIERFTSSAFAVIEFDVDMAGPTALNYLAELLDLGELFVPPLYKSGDVIAAPFSRISAGSRTYGSHPAFESNSGLDMHCDGTLQEIGLVKTSLLVCETPAAEGGATTLFNAAAAYGELARADGPAASALANPSVLVRRANINGCDDANIGPGFTLKEGKLVCGYSVSTTDTWQAPPNLDPDDLERGLDFLRRASAPDSPWYTEVNLRRGQALVLDNTTLSHGRRPYRDSPTLQRCLYRGLYLTHPNSKGASINHKEQGTSYNRGVQ